MPTTGSSGNKQHHTWCHGRATLGLRPIQRETFTAKQVRIQKVLDCSGVRIGGINGRRILEGIVAGQTREAILRTLTWHVRKKIVALGDALSFELDEHSRWILDLFETQSRLLETIPGVCRESAMAVLIELGPDMSVFPSARKCTAWAVLVECAHAAARTKDCQFQGYHEAEKNRRGYKRSIVATAHKMLRIIYAMLRDAKPYADPGLDYERISIDRRASR